MELHRFDRAGVDLSFDLQLSEGFVDLPPRFTGAPKLGGGLWHIGIVGPAGALVTIEASSDLQNWTVAGQVVLTGGSAQFQESLGTNGPQRFYRLRD